MVMVPNRSANKLIPIIENHIAAGSIIISDLKHNNAFQHMQINHKYNSIDPDSGAHTQNIERLWQSAKVRNKRHTGTNRSMLDSYISEFLWRQKHKKNICLFTQIISDIVKFMPPS